MKRYPIYFIFSLILPSFLLGSCGEDRSGEYYALIAAKTWIYETMQQNYLFYADLPAEGDIDFFKKPQDFLASVVSEKDKKGSVTFSHIDSISRRSRVETAYPSFGLEGTMIRLEDGTNAVRILYVQKQSPAEEAGLKRGSCIIAVDSQKITSSNYSEFFQYPTQSYRYMLISPHTATQEEENKPQYDTCEIQMPAPRVVEQPSVFMTKNITISGGRKAFYMMYNSFEPEEEEKLKSAFAEGMSASPNDVILDLRYNPGGYVSTSILLSSLLAPSGATGQTCLKLIYNDKINKEETITFQQDITSYPYDNLYIITSANTASASEVVINCLRPYLGNKLIQVGEATFGKNVAQSLFTTPEYPELEFWLTTAYLSNAKGEYDYFTNGLIPNYKVSENPADKLGELGTSQDTLLYSVMYHMEHQKFPEPQQPENPEKSKRVLYNPIATKAKCCKLPESHQLPQ